MHLPVKSVLITGGVGFVGFHLAKALRQNSPDLKITLFDNLKRRGSEFNIPTAQKLGMHFVHGDLRIADDLESLSTADLMIEASAEPSVLAGTRGDSPAYALETNLVGTIRALEWTRKRGGAFLFLSTSRVFSIEALKSLPLTEETTRFSTPKDIDEGFEKSGARSVYGTSKLCSEHLVEEFGKQYKIPTLINRCGVLTGEGQFGKVDQGVFALWVAAHHFGKSLKYTGFGGTGKQVRDLLHPSDLYKLISLQLQQIENWNGDVFNVGGGRENSTSLLEWTQLCQKATGKKITIDSDTMSASVDIPYYVTDYKKTKKQFGWNPSLSLETIANQIASWVKENEEKLKPLFS
jgi:CDP-paratose 2-epimerase